MSARVELFIDALTDTGVLSRQEIDDAQRQMTADPLTTAASRPSELTAGATLQTDPDTVDISLFLSTDDLRQTDQTRIVPKDAQASDLTGQAASTASTPDAVLELAHQLVRQNKLTAFQARAACKGDRKLLRCGDYHLLDLIGSGGMGHVFKARYDGSEDLFAIKILRDSAQRSPGRLARFHREIEVTSRLTHTNIVTAQTAGESDGSHYLVMELVDGRDLKSLVRESGPVAIAEAVDYISQAARGLDYAHSQRLVHRDIKPANLLLDADGIIRVLDLGLVQIVEEEQADNDVEDVTRLTVQGQVLGTPDYMSPEQAEDTRSVDKKTDIYSLGCTLHFLLTGRPPFLGATPVEVMMAHSTQPIPWLRHQRSHVPLELDELFQRLMAKEPDDRPESFAPVIAELESISAALTSDAQN